MPPLWPSGPQLLFSPHLPRPASYLPLASLLPLLSSFVAPALHAPLLLYVSVHPPLSCVSLPPCLCPFPYPNCHPLPMNPCASSPCPSSSCLSSSCHPLNPNRHHRCRYVCSCAYPYSYLSLSCPCPSSDAYHLAPFLCVSDLPSLSDASAPFHWSRCPRNRCQHHSSPCHLYHFSRCRCPASWHPHSFSFLLRRRQQLQSFAAAPLVAACALPPRVSSRQ
mmetsp:Transcript_103190/g.179015  ORF Transcript_103190/g.179015 Transcript_103190/m.179015 type:complete len:221 (-) Transcript_103190:904-1566(-)